ncbi:MAG TPA: DUF3597 domain-containing protein [Gemmatirosa sp.]
MSIFGTIMSKIFHHDPAAAAPAVTAAAPSADTATAAAADSTADAAGAAGDAAEPAVDVEQMLTSIAAQYPHPVNWRYSIVDLLAILGIDNSLAQRKALAAELGYTGDTNDSATMNIWLHKEVMRKLAENGGRVPADLLN